MVRLPAPRRSDCPINFGLQIFGDSWTLLILRDMLIQGKRSFRAFLASEEKIASNILTDRLRRLESCGLISRVPSAEDRRLILYEPTDAARDLLPVLIEMSYWGARHDPGTAAPPEFVAAYQADRDSLMRAIRGGFDPSGGAGP